jgi:hypothetical protein
MTTIYRLEREEPGLFRVFYRAHGRRYCLRNDGGHGRRDLTFYQCSRDGEPQQALGFVPNEDEFDRYVEP